MAREKVKKKSSRYAVVVLGMHRSGTSALAGVLARLGCDVPKDIMQPAPQNPKGFYESLSVSALDDAILGSAGASWYSWQGINKEWFRSPKAEEFLERADQGLSEAFGKAKLIVLKDPRICLLVPFWESVFTQNHFQPLYLHTHRHPLEVASSIGVWAGRASDRLPGYSTQLGQLIWLRYVLESEAATRGKVRHFTSYDLLLQDWRKLAKQASKAFSLPWPSLSEQVADEVGSFLDTSLNHEAGRVAAETGRMNPWVAATYEVMERWAAHGERQSDYAELDQIREQFNLSCPVFSQIVDTARLNSSDLTNLWQQERQTTAKLESARADTARVRIEVDNLTQQLSELSGSVTQKAEEKSALEAQVGILLAEVDSLRARADAAQSYHFDLEAKLAVADREAAEAQQRIETAEANVATLTQQLQQANQERSSLEARLDEEVVQGKQALLLELEELTHRNAQLESELAQRRLEAEEVGHECASVKVQKAQLERDLGVMRAHHDDVLAKQNEITRMLRLEVCRLEEQREKDLTDLAARLGEREDAAQSEIKAMERGMELARTHIGALLEEKTRLQRDAEEKLNNMRQMEERVQAADKQIATLTNALQSARVDGEKTAAERESFLRELRKEKLRVEHDMQNQLVMSLRSYREALEQERTQSSAALAEAQEARERAVHELLEKKYVVDEILSSTSWRLTSPLRSVSTGIRSLFGRK